MHCSSAWQGVIHTQSGCFLDKNMCEVLFRIAGFVSAVSFFIGLDMQPAMHLCQGWGQSGQDMAGMEC